MNTVLSLSEFFDAGKHDSALVQEAIQELRHMEERDVRLLLDLIRRITETR